jgi:hypothetical protein
VLRTDDALAMANNSASLRDNCQWMRDLSKPRPIHDVSFLARSQSKIDEEVRVTVAVLTAEESRQLFGVNLAGQGIQPVWVRVQNADTVPYWLLSTGLDPDYFSPLESAYAFHGAFSSNTNAKIDD